jgi:hypothetical protein
MHRFILKELAEFIHTHPDTSVSEIFPQYLYKEAEFHILLDELYTLQDEFITYCRLKGIKVNADVQSLLRLVIRDLKVTLMWNKWISHNKSLLNEPVSHTDSDFTIVIKMSLIY